MLDSGQMNAQTTQTWDDLLAKWPQDEFALGNSRMWYLEGGLIHDLIVICEYVKVNRPRSVRYGLDTSERAFDVLQLIKQRRWRRRCFNLLE